MKLGKLKKALSALLIVGMTSSPVLATEVAMSKQVATGTGVSVPIGESEEWLDWREQEIQFIRQHGEEVNVSAVNDTVKVTIEYVLADAYSPQFLLVIEKLDEIPFKSIDGLRTGWIRIESKEERDRQARFDEIPEDAPFVEHLKVMAEFDEDLNVFINEDDTVDMDGLMEHYEQTAYIMMSGTSSASYGMTYTEENTDSKVYYTYKPNDTESFATEIIMKVEDISVEQGRTEEVAVDIVSYLEEQQGEELLTRPNTIDEHELEYLEYLKEADEEYYLERKEALENEPQNLLAEAGLNIPLLQDEDSFVIDNIGFIEDELHILMLGEGNNWYNLDVYDQDGNWVWSTYSTGSSTTLEDGTRRREEYSVYDISSVEELSNYSFEVQWREVIEEWPGTWEIELDMSDMAQPKIIEVNEMISYSTGETANLSEIHMGKVSVALVIDQIESETLNGNIDLSVNIIFKDGTEEELRYSGASRYEVDKVMEVYPLGNRLSEDIAYIEINDKKFHVSLD